MNSSRKTQSKHVTGQHAQDDQALAAAILDLLNSAEGNTDTVRGILALIKADAGCETTEIRTQEGDAFAQEREKTLSESERLSHLRILVVDDDALTRRLLVRVLKADSHFVATAKSGAEGIAMFKDGSFDLVLTDRAMPDLSGDKVAEALKALKPEVPIILLTGFGDIMKDKGEVPQHVDRVMGKPVTTQDLRNVIAKVLNV